jgi:GINS complex subunit 1
MERVERIKKLRWEVDASIPEAIAHNFGHHEVTFLKQYDQILCEYIEGVGIDVTKDYHPPQDLYVQVRVLRECEVMDSKGGNRLTLKLNRSYYLLRSDVEHLVRNGSLQHVSD